jgi:hypothetical protein
VQLGVAEIAREIADGLRGRVPAAVRDRMRALELTTARCAGVQARNVLTGCRAT